MSGDNVPQETPTLEMRLAAIEDKLARLTVTEEEMAAYSKIAGLAASRGGGGPAPVPALSPRVCSISSPVSHCWVYIQNCFITPPIVVNDCIQFLAGVASSGGGFSRLGGG